MIVKQQLIIKISSNFTPVLCNICYICLQCKHFEEKEQS